MPTHRRWLHVSKSSLALSLCAGALTMFEAVLWYVSPPRFASVLGIGAAGTVIAAYGVGSMLLALPAGDLADKIGRRFVFVSGVALFIASLFLIESASFWKLLVFMLLLGVASTFIAAGAGTTVMDDTSKSSAGEASGAFGSIVSLSWSLGSFVGGLTIAFLPFGVLVKALMVILLAFLYWGVRKYPDRERMRWSDVARSVRVLEKDRLYVQEVRDVLPLGLALTAFSAYCFVFGFFEYAIWVAEPVYAGRIGASAAIGGGILALATLPKFLCSPSVGKFIDRANGAALMVCGAALILAAHAYFIVLSDRSLIPLGLTFFLVALADVLISLPFIAYVRQAVHKTLRARTYGTGATLYGLGGIAGPLLIGRFGDATDFRLLLMVTGTMFVPALLLIIYAASTGRYSAAS